MNTPSILVGRAPKKRLGGRVKFDADGDSDESDGSYVENSSLTQKLLSNLFYLLEVSGTNKVRVRRFGVGLRVRD
jgi:hypothetical protein